ncbi:hypothetical protein [uncultured Tenacibaculum sp.]|uniref:hypothetical protein n=1 Tax=uncultured Tenacibaculum sp. TaxID=174713 RepID=UPI002626A269|nr:hypothetical protein [uncultured Tenacibaculum sp.]
MVDLDPQDPEDNELGDQWNDANVGNGSISLGNSTAAGTNTIAIGDSNLLTSAAGESIAIGKGNEITANTSYAFGFGNRLNGFGSVAVGFENMSAGLAAVAIGFVTHAGSYAQTTVGLNSKVVDGNKNTYVATDRLFVIGNGT